LLPATSEQVMESSLHVVFGRRAAPSRPRV
jgi:hypothetical protein